jgi:hypothetical protein
MVRVVAFVLPGAVSWLVVRSSRPVLWHPSGSMGWLPWLAQLAVVTVASVLVVERFTRRLLPLGTLLGLSLVFPDHAPSRFSVALRGGTVKALAARAEALRHSQGGEPNAIAAEIVELVSALARHERLTRGHTERVRAYSAMIGEELGLSDHDRELLNWSCLVHDIGKLSVPPEILNKAGRPTDEEWAVLRRHPEVGGEIVEPLAPFLGEWRLSASQHHERWEGGGYPQGLAGTEISLAGRIVAVADAYDVITSTRSYKKPMSVEAARSELVRCAGTQFDPAVVRAFLHVSIGRLSLVTGPLGWLREIPRIGEVAAQAVSNAGAAVAVAVVATTALVGIAAPAGPPAAAASAAPSGPAAGGNGTGPTPGVARVASEPDQPGSGTATTTGGHAPGAATTTSKAPVLGGATTTSGPNTSTTRGTSGAGTTTTTALAGSPPSTTTTVNPGSPTGPTTTTTTTTPTPTTTTTPATTTTASNVAPVARADSASVFLASSVSIDVLANDTDADGNLDSSTLAITTAPGRGSASVSGGRVVYSPGGILLGSTTFVYRVCDTRGACANATVSVTILFA